MCGRVNVTDYTSIIQLMESMDFPIGVADFSNVSAKLFPYYRPLLTGFINPQNQTDSALMNWGWERDWDTDKRLFNSRRINNKGKSIWQSPVWGQSICNRRCIVPVNAFYEWNENQPKGKRDRYRIETHEPAFGLGGIYEISQDGEMFFSICTTEPNKHMAEIHHRMPVIVDKKDAEQWLYSTVSDEVDELMQAKNNHYIVMHKETDVGHTLNLF